MFKRCVLSVLIMCLSCAFGNLYVPTENLGIAQHITICDIIFPLCSLSIYQQVISNQRFFINFYLKLLIFYINYSIVMVLFSFFIHNKKYQQSKYQITGTLFMYLISFSKLNDIVSINFLFFFLFMLFFFWLIWSIIFFSHLFNSFNKSCFNSILKMFVYFNPFLSLFI